MKRFILILILLSSCFVCLGNNRDSLTIRNHNHLISFSHDTICFVDSLSNACSTGHMFIQKSIIVVDTSSGLIHLEVDKISGYYIISRIRIVDGKTIYDIEDQDVIYIIIDEEKELFFVRKSGEIMILK